MNKRSAGKQILETLKQLGRAKKQAGKATTEQLAVALGISPKDAYSRLWWMCHKDGTLVQIGGQGKSAVWRVAPKARKPSEQETTSEADGEQAV